MSFVPLRVRSHGSLLHGTASPAALVARALEAGYEALALTDRDNLYLAIAFLRAARSERLVPLLGAEVTVPAARGAAAVPADPAARGPAAPAALLLALDRRGYANLCALLSARHLEPDFDLVRALAALHAGLHVVVESPGLATALLAAGVPAAHGCGAAARDGAGGRPGGLWLGIRGLAAERPRLPARVAAARRTGIPLVATGEVAMLEPRAPLPDGWAGPAWLRRLADEGLVRRYRDPAALRAARARLDRELGVVDRLGFTDYFLLVAEIVGFARERGIPTVGRGSGASSIVSYALGITNADPLRHGLCFERFLHPQRRDCPDLDVDLCWKRRDEVIRHVYDTYGHDRVAMISTHATLGARSAFRETAKALGVPAARVDALAKRVPHALEPPYLDRLERLPGARAVAWREPVLAEALRLAERLDGAPRHLSVHPGGMVIADRPLTWYVPLERAAKGVVVTQFEMRAIEAIGLVKMDLLGNRALSTIGECLALARRPRADGGPAPPVPDPDAIPEDDAATGARVAAGDTLDCFQLESPAMRHLLRMLGARTLEDTIAAVALVRPGPAESGMKEAYCRRHRGLESAAFHDPRLVPVLGGTHGVMLYEEDVMRVAAALAGLTLAEGDDLRRAISAARTDEEIRALERGFVAQAAGQGVAAETARAVWRDLARFAAYAFCKAHAAGYGTLGWQSAYLKGRFPVEWAVGILNHHAGMYATWVHVEDLRRQGVRFEAPCANRSAWDTTLEEDAAGARVRVGLGRVFGLSEATGGRIVAARAERPFRTLADLVDRARPTLPELESLALAGALDWTARSRSSLLLEARVGGAPARHGRAPASEPALVAADGAALAPEPVTPVAAPDLPEFDPAERVRGECRATGLWFGAHPLDVFVAPGDLAGTVPASGVAARAGRRIAVAGMPCAYRRVETKKGDSMLFMTLADRSGLAECVLFPDALRRWADAVRGQVVRVEGRVDEALDAVTVTVERAAALA